MEMMKLRNGKEEADVMVKVMRMSLSGLLDGSSGLNGILAVYEIGKLAKNPKHEIFSEGQLKLLLDLNLLEQGSTRKAARMHDTTRNVVDALIEFVGEEPTLVNPYTPRAPVPAFVAAATRSSTARTGRTSRARTPRGTASSGPTCPRTSPICGPSSWMAGTCCAPASQQEYPPNGHKWDEVNMDKALFQWTG